jgi:hypothetical protein
MSEPAPAASSIGRDVALLFLGFLFTSVGALYTHQMDRNNWEKQHNIERDDAVRLDRARIFDSTMLAFGRLILAGQFLRQGLEERNASKRELADMTDAYNAEFEHLMQQKPRLVALVGVYYSESVDSSFQSTLRLVNRTTEELTNDLNHSTADPQRSDKLDSLRNAVAVLGKQMTLQQLSRLPRQNE